MLSDTLGTYPCTPTFRNDLFAFWFSTKGNLYRKCYQLFGRFFRAGLGAQFISSPLYFAPLLNLQLYYQGSLHPSAASHLLPFPSITLQNK